MDSQYPTLDGPGTQHPNAEAPQHKDTLPPDGISGKYRVKNPPEPMSIHQVVYVLSYEGCAWPNYKPYDGILGVYTRLDNAQRAGTCWLRDKLGLRSNRFDTPETRVSEWKAIEADEVWEKGMAQSGIWFLESRRMRIKKCEVRTDSSLPDGSQGEIGKKDEDEDDNEDEDEGGNKDEEKGEKEHDGQGDVQGDVEAKGEASTVGAPGCLR